MSHRQVAGPGAHPTTRAGGAASGLLVLIFHPRGHLLLARLMDRL